MPENNDSKEPINSLDNLKPQDIDFKNIKNDLLRNQAEKIVEEWLGNIHEDISKLLEKHGLTTFQISFVHPGTKSPMLLMRGDLLQTTILAATATRQLKAQIEERIQV